MCKRYGLVAPREEVRAVFGVVGQGGRLPPRYNIAPGQPIVVVVIPPRQAPRRLLPCRWGLIPHWAAGDGTKPGRACLRAATALRQRRLRDLLARRRCLVPATGFYLWQRQGRRSRPWHVRRGDGGLFAFAAIWDSWRSPAGEEIKSCASLSTAPNPLLAPLAPEAPVVVPPGRWAEWLEPAAADPDRLGWLREPWSDREFTAYPVSAWVNDPRHDDPRCVVREWG